VWGKIIDTYFVIHGSKLMKLLQLIVTV